MYQNWGKHSEPVWGPQQLGEMERSLQARWGIGTVGTPSVCTSALRARGHLWLLLPGAHCGHKLTPHLRLGTPPAATGSREKCLLRFPVFSIMASAVLWVLLMALGALLGCREEAGHCWKMSSCLVRIRSCGDHPCKTGNAVWGPLSRGNLWRCGSSDTQAQKLCTSCDIPFYLVLKVCSGLP